MLGRFGDAPPRARLHVGHTVAALVECLIRNHAPIRSTEVVARSRRTVNGSAWRPPGVNPIARLVDDPVFSGGRISVGEEDFPAMIGCGQLDRSRNEPLRGMRVRPMCARAAFQHNDVIGKFTWRAEHRDRRKLALGVACAVAGQ